VRERRRIEENIFKPQSTMAPQPAYGGRSNPHKQFGQTMHKKSSSSSSRYQRQFGNGRGGNHSRIMSSSDVDGNGSGSGGQSQFELKAQEAAARRRLRQEQGETIDTAFGYNRLEDHPGAAAAAAAAAAGTANSSGGVGPYNKNKEKTAILQRRGWLFHMLATTVRNRSSEQEAMAYYACLEATEIAWI
jgi:hypothetical protein